MESQFFEPPVETKLRVKNRRVREVGNKGIVFELGEGNDFCFELTRGSKKWGLQKSRFHCSLKKNKQDAVFQEKKYSRCCIVYILNFRVGDYN